MDNNVNTPTLSTQQKTMHQIQVLPTLNIIFLVKYEWSVKSKQLNCIYFSMIKKHVSIKSN